jgi:hypothetical protein
MQFHDRLVYARREAEVVGVEDKAGHAKPVYNRLPNALKSRLTVVFRDNTEVGWSLIVSFSYTAGWLFWANQLTVRRI